MLTGGCLCRRVRYEVRGTPFHETICHCAACRLATGAASVAWFSARTSDFTWTKARPTAFASSAGVTRTFCGGCGTSLTYRRHELETEIDVTICSLDRPDDVPPADHTWTRDGLEWDTICDGRPAHPRARPVGS